MESSNKKAKIEQLDETEDNILFTWCVNKGNEIVKTLGRGHRENIYHKAFEIELKNNGIQYESEYVIPIIYKNQQIGYGRADIVVAKKIILEFKAIYKSVGPAEIRQIKNYMEFTGLKRGIILNFAKGSDNDDDVIDFIYVNS